MTLTPAQQEMVIRIVLAIVASGRWPSPEDIRQSVQLSDELLGLGALLEAGAETAAAVMSVDEWRSKRAPPHQVVAPRHTDSPK